MSKPVVEPPKETDPNSVFYPPRKVPKYEMMENIDLMSIVMTLREKRRTGVEGHLYLKCDENKENADYILTGEADLVKKEKEKYLNYIVTKHKKWIPTDLLKDKLQRKFRRVQTIKLKTDKDDKKEQHKDLRNIDKEDLHYNDSQNDDREDYEEFEDLEDMDEDYGMFEEADERYGGDEGGGDDY